jgi:hypothetical protein
MLRVPTWLQPLEKCLVQLPLGVTYFIRWDVGGWVRCSGNYRSIKL